LGCTLTSAILNRTPRCYLFTSKLRVITRYSARGCVG